MPVSVYVRDVNRLDLNDPNLSAKRREERARSDAGWIDDVYDGFDELEHVLALVNSCVDADGVLVGAPISAGDFDGDSRLVVRHRVLEVSIESVGANLVRRLRHGDLSLARPMLHLVVDRSDSIRRVVTGVD